MVGHIYVKSSCIYVYIYLLHIHTYIVVGVIQMGNNVLKAGLEPTFLGFGASVLPFHHVDSLMSPLDPHPPIYVARCLNAYSPLPPPPGFVSLLMLTIT